MEENGLTTDEKIINGCIHGDRNSQELLYRKFGNKMYSVCLVYANDRDEAKDILQEGFIKVFTSIKKYNGDGSLGGWIRRIIVNTAIDYYRKTLKEQKNEEIENAGNIEMNFDVLEGMQAKELMELVRKLPEGARLVFNLYVVEGYNHKEIAEMLNINIGTSKSQFARAKSILQVWLPKFYQVKVTADYSLN